MALLILFSCFASSANLTLYLGQLFCLFRMRDSALRALALSSRRSHEFYLPILLQHVTLNVKYIVSFYHFLRRNEACKDLIEAICFTQLKSFVADDQYKVASQLDDLLDSIPNLDGFKDAETAPLKYARETISKVTMLLYQSLPSLRTLIVEVESDTFIPRSLELPCLSKSLTKLFIPFVESSTSRLNAKNVVWLLVFTSIQEGSLGFELSINDYKYLSEYAQSFSNLSKVKKLALRFQFVSEKSDRRTRWKSLMEMESTGGYNNQKTEAIALLLSVVDRLSCLEVSLVRAQEEPNPHDDTELILSYLYGSRFLSSLRHLRLLDLELPTTDLDVSLSLIAFPKFNCLETLALDRDSLFHFTRSITKLPFCLKRIIIHYYQPSKEPEESFEEDGFLIQIIESHSLDQLEEVIVPSGLVGPRGELLDAVKYPEHHRVWREKRIELEKAAIFESGKVKLRTMSPGQIGE